MSVIIRLQNLPLLANAHDIRQYFAGLSIPEGGVHIVGGEKGDAFIAFSTDEDARRAFNRNNGKIKDAQVTLLLSSRSEMQKVIEMARKQSMAAFMSAPPSATLPILPSVVPSTAGVLSEMRGRPRGDASRTRSRSRSRSRDRFDRRHSRSSSRERHRRRSRSRSPERSRSRERKVGKLSDAKAPHRVDVWAARPTAPPSVNALAGNADATNLLANIMANNLLPNIIGGNNTITQLAAVLQEHLHKSNAMPTTPSPNQPAFTNGDDASHFTSAGTHLANRAGVRARNTFSAASGPQNNGIKLFPFFGALSDVAEFFSGSEIANPGIISCKDVFGNRNGQVIVNFVYPESKVEALGRSGERIRNQAVSIEHVPDSEFVAMCCPPFNEARPQHANSSRHVMSEPVVANRILHLKIEMLPNFVTPQDVRQAFRSYPLAAVAIEPRGRFKSAYLRFANATDAELAFADRSKHVFEGKPFNVVVASERDFEMVAHEFGTDAPPPPQTSGASNVILLSGLPPKCSDRDVADFFSDIGVMPAKISMMANMSGYCEEAACEFYHVDEAVQAFQKNGALFGNSVISMRFEAFDGPMLPTLMNMQPHQASTAHQASFFQNPNHFNGPMMRGPPASNRMQDMPSPHLRMFDGHHQQRHHPQAHDFGDDDAIAPPGCVLLMENVPYKSGIDEILHFLGDFHIPCDNVLRKYNGSGLPSGEAKIIFNSPEEAYHAMQQCRGRKMRDRVIHLMQI